MHDLFNVHAEAERLKHLRGHFDGVVKGGRTDDTPRRFIFYAEQQIATVLVRKRHAVFVELAIVELILGFLELEVLMLGWSGSPCIDLSNGDRHD